MTNAKSEAPDKRKIAIYARKSKITETGKSIENQISRCRGYAELKFGAGDDDFVIYRDEGLSGFYADRPQYIRMLNDLREGRIKAVVCYKFDRISRRTVDLLNLVEQLRQKKIAFISCTDDVDTSSKTGRIMMSLLASIAEFERDIIAERISDNMYELAKEGRWLGGVTPTGFYSKREYVVLGGRRNSVNHLEPVMEEQAAVKEMFRRFLEERSLQRVVDWANGRKVTTKNGKTHTRTSVRDILKNPVYAMADADMYAYFSALGVPVYAGREDFDGEHGLMVYNKTEQVKELRDDSTMASPAYSKKTDRRVMEDWVISVGRHKGLVSGRDWIATQSIIRENRDKYNRPNEKTHSLLSGIIACPCCGKNLFTQKESGRLTDGEPRYLYKCPTKRKDRTACSYKDVKGNEIDRFVIDAICDMADEGGDYYENLLAGGALWREKLTGMEQRIHDLEKQIEKYGNDIENQTKSLRLATDVSKPFILEDIDKLASDLERLEGELDKLREKKRGIDLEADIFEKTKELIFSFPGLMKNLPYQEKSELIREIVDKVFVVRSTDGDDEVHIFVKGTPDEEYGLLAFRKRPNV